MQTFFNNSPKLNLDILEEALRALNREPVLTRIKFSNVSGCELKKLFFDAFDKLPTQQVEYLLFGGVEIKTSLTLPENMMIFEYNNKDTKFFVYKDGKIYELDTKYKPDFDEIYRVD